MSYKKETKKIVLATNNSDKLAELQYLFTDSGFTLLLQSEFDVPEIEETGLTFVENALLKARNACQYTNLPALADDSGLEVDALGGLPGIYSARFAGKNSTHAEKNAKLLEDLKDVPEQSRTARFHCVLIYLRNAADPVPLICHGIWEGNILFAPRGKYGFGYDPVFFVPTHNCSAAELPAEIKNQISHRAQALRQFLIYSQKEKDGIKIL
jgi:XTP/dITP diphosphohydrolase